MRVAAIDDLIRMQRTSARPRDMAHREVLMALRDEIDETNSR